MKYILMMALLFSVSCTTGRNANEVEDGESNAKQVSPYTVEPCLCMKIFKPVCGGDGTNYGNSCEAECHGNTKWTEGSCKKR